MKKLFAATIVLILICASHVNAETIRVATWNIEHLRAEDVTGNVKRNREDYAALADYANRLDADIVALQEVDGPEAAARVFDPEEYTFIFSDRNNVLRTGFAIRRSIVVVDDSDLVELSLGGSVRRGTDVTVQVNGKQLRILAVHLKSGCFDRPLNADTNACNKLERQLPILEQWIDDRTREGIPFIVLGDFNRRFDTEDGALEEMFFPQIDDGDPAPLNLFRFPVEGTRSECSGGKFPIFIDHIILDEQANKLFVPASFRQLVFSERDELDFKLSDHCPISVQLVLHENGEMNAFNQAESLVVELRTLVHKINEKVEDLHELLPHLKE